jgi:pyridoxamine 5'-phosphate oxidase
MDLMGELGDPQLNFGGIDQDLFQIGKNTCRGVVHVVGWLPYFLSQMQSDGKPNLADLRQNYMKGDLLEAQIPTDPLELFSLWMADALLAGVVEPNAMTLATVSADGQPSARTVLLKGMDSRGFSFFTNYGSRKGRELQGNAKAALVFFWRECERQVCVRGTVTKLGREESEVYFKSRPYGSQIGAWVSEQSSLIPGREWLDARDAELRALYPEGEVPLPENWGGFVLAPVEIEFWQGRPSRLHDRILFQRDGEGWQMGRLSP